MTGTFSSKSAAVLVTAILSAGLAASAQAQDLWINELHYDNSGGDVNEFVEVVVADSVSTAPADIDVVLYNGNGGVTYDTDSLDSFSSTSVPGYTIYTLVYPANGIQNGPDGVALVDNGALVQFLSYEGSFTASSGPAAGQTSVDIGVEEAGSAIGESLQLAGTGSSYSDFTWQVPAAETPGAVNNGQSLELPAPVLNEIGISDVGTDAEFFEIVGLAGTDLLGLQLLVVSGVENTNFGFVPGQVIAQFNLSGTIPGDGFWAAMSPEAETTYGVTADQGFPDNTLANLSATYLLVSDFTGAIGDDLDTNDDGVLDSTPWTAELDSIAVIDDDSPLIYSTTVVGPDGTFLPPGAERCPDGSGAWFQLEFNPENGTPGAANGCSGPLPPEVVSVDPADSATGIPLDTTIIANFNQSIDATVDAFTLDCGSGPVAFTGLPVNGGSQIVITPDADLPASATCNATVVAAEVTGSTGGLPMDADFAWSFQTGIGATGWVINEINADPDATNGDANGDGTVNTSEDEFVEIVNTTGVDVDISGWTLADGFGVRHTFPAGTVVTDGCGIVVFGGGTPTGGFGGALVQTASDGSLGLNNGGDSVTLSDGVQNQAVVNYGSEGGNNQSITRDPDLSSGALVQHSTATGSGGALFSPGTRIDGASFAGCTPPVSAWVINEVHADPDAANGDANGDGTVNGNEDEFVELVNATGSDVDISGWTLADGVSVRHIFPAGTVVADGCVVVVFGGGTPTGTFGGALAQTASEGGLGLNNTGDSIILNDGLQDQATVTYGPEGGDNQSITLDPDISGSTLVAHSTATGSGGALFSPGTRVDGSQFSGCDGPPPGPVEIFEIQGAGAASPFNTQIVTTENNVVTAVTADGFFMQTPDARADASVDTSNGIFVFTGGAPGVAVGDLVDVTGEVVEFFNFTEFTNGPTVTVTGSGAALPAAVVFDASVPSSNPLAPSCAIEFECYEGMRISLPEGIVGSGNQAFGVEPLAEVSVKAGSERNLREPGIEFPGLAGLPVWDGNPEVFEISPAALGLPELALFGGTRVQAEGVLAFSFGDYELWPSTLTILEAPTLPGTAPAVDAGNVAIGSINVFRLFDDVDDPGPQDDGQVADPAVYASRLSRFADHIVNAMGAPAVIAFQEVESENVLLDLAAAIATIDAGLVYSAELIEGNDVGGIDVGYLVREDVTVLNVDQLGENELLSFDNSLLHDRPPLLLQVRFADGADTLDVNLLAVHNRSLGGIEGSDEVRVRTKRLEQAQSIGQMAQDLQTAQPDTPLVVLGDFNAFEFTDGYVDVIGQIAGTAVAADNDFWAPPIPSPGLEVATLSLPAQERYSFVFQGNAQALDHALYNADAAPNFVSMTYTRGQADAPEAYNETPPAGEEGLGISDHDSFVIQLAIVAEVLFADGFESN